MYSSRKSSGAEFGGRVRGTQFGGRSSGRHAYAGRDVIDPRMASCYRPPALRRPRASLAISVALTSVAAASLSGCGPIEYINQVGIKAASAVSAAKLAQGDRYAPYEYTAAEEYLHKAREEAGYAEYQDSIEYGRKAEELANRARAIAVSRLSTPEESPRPAAPKPVVAPTK
jgi:hypothetical protein